MMNMFPMATWDTLCHHLGWLSPLVSYFTQASDGRDLGLCFLSIKMNAFHLFTGQNLQNVLAVANEEGIVRIYNTGSCDKPLLKGMCKGIFI